MTQTERVTRGQYRAIVHQAARAKHLGTLEGLEVYRVDGTWVRDHLDVDYTEGSNFCRSPMIPMGEIWIEEGADKDVAATIVHELIEVDAMLHGCSYDEAHDCAAEIEAWFRTTDVDGNPFKAAETFLAQGSEGSGEPAGEAERRDFAAAGGGVQLVPFKALLVGESFLRADARAGVLTKISTAAAADKDGRTVVVPPNEDCVRLRTATARSNLTWSRGAHQRYKATYEDEDGEKHDLRINGETVVDHGHYGPGKKQRRKTVWSVTVDGKSLGEASTLREAKELAETHLGLELPEPEPPLEVGVDDLTPDIYDDGGGAYGDGQAGEGDDQPVLPEDQPGGVLGGPAPGGGSGGAGGDSGASEWAKRNVGPAQSRDVPAPAGWQPQPFRPEGTPNLNEEVYDPHTGLLSEYREYRNDPAGLRRPGGEFEEELLDTDYVELVKDAADRTPPRAYVRDPATLDVGPVQKVNLRAPGDQGYKNVLAVLSKATPEEIDYWSNWYGYGHLCAVELAQKHNVPLDVAAGVIAVLSPQELWDANLYFADRALARDWTNVKALDTSRKKAYSLVVEGDFGAIRGQKVFDFFLSLLDPVGFEERVVKDTHVTNIWRGIRTGQAPGLNAEALAALNRDYARAGETAGLSPQVTQAVTWVIWRQYPTLTGTAPIEVEKPKPGKGKLPAPWSGEGLEEHELQDLPEEEFVAPRERQVFSERLAATVKLSQPAFDILWGALAADGVLYEVGRSQNNAPYFSTVIPASYRENDRDYPNLLEGARRWAWSSVEALVRKGLLVEGPGYPGVGPWAGETLDTFQVTPEGQDAVEQFHARSKTPRTFYTTSAPFTSPKFISSAPFTATPTDRTKAVLTIPEGERPDDWVRQLPADSSTVSGRTRREPEWRLRKSNPPEWLQSYQGNDTGHHARLLTITALNLVPRGRHAHGYPWGGREADVHPHTSVPEWQPKNEQVVQPGQAAGDYYTQLARAYGDVQPGTDTSLQHYDYRAVEPAIDDLVKQNKYEVYYAGGKYGRPDLGARNYNTGHLQIYDPTPGQGGDFGDEATTRSWRKIHELSHALTYKGLNDKYGEGRRIGKLGYHRSLREAKRAVHWEWLAAHKQRELSTQVGHPIDDATFNKELNCLDAETEALTKRGWVKGFDLKRSDVLLTKNAATGRLEWQHLTDLKLFPDYEGSLVEFKSKSFHTVTTPEHRWLVTTNQGRVRERTSSTLVLKGDQIHRTGVYLRKESVLSPDEAELVGWFVTDGFYKRNPACNGKHAGRGSAKYAVPGIYAHLTQSITANPAKCARIDTLLYRLDQKREVSRNKADNKDGGRVWLLGPTLTALLLKYAPRRRLEVSLLCKLDSAALLRLRKALLAGDGSRGGTRKAQQSFCTGDRGQSDAFQMLLVLTGCSSYAVWRDMSKHRPKSKKLRNVPKSSGAFYVNIHTRQFTKPEKKHKRVYSAKVPVWCPVVPNTFFVARRSGQVFITGNTVMHDAVHRAVTGKFTNPHEEGFVPSDKLVPLEVSLGQLEDAARKLGLQGEDDVLRKSALLEVTAWDLTAIVPRAKDAPAEWHDVPHPEPKRAPTYLRGPSRKRQAPDELRLKADGGYQNIMKVIALATPEETSFWGGWYQRANGIVREMAGRFGLPFETVAGVVAVLSPGNRWPQNIETARQIISWWLARGEHPHDPALSGIGPSRIELTAADLNEDEDEDSDRITYEEEGVTYEGPKVKPKAGPPLGIFGPRPSAYPANTDKAVRILDGEPPEAVLAGPKVTTFFETIVDPSSVNAVVLDGHAINLWRGQKRQLKGIKEPTKDERARMERDYARAARATGLPVHGVQALSWYLWKTVEAGKTANVRPGDEPGESVGVFLPVPAELAAGWPTNEKDSSPPHFTLLDVGAVDEDRRDELVEVVREVAAQFGPIEIELAKGVGYFTNDDGQEIAHKGVTPETEETLAALHAVLREALEDAGFEVGHHDSFIAHATLAYLDDRSYDGPVPEGAWTADELEVWGWPETGSVELGWKRAAKLRRDLVVLAEDLDEGGVHRTAARPRPRWRKRRRIVRPSWYMRENSNIAFTAAYGTGGQEVYLKPNARVLEMSEAGLQKRGARDDDEDLAVLFAELAQRLASRAKAARPEGNGELVEAVKTQAAAIERLVALLSGGAGGAQDYDAIRTEDRLIVLNPEAVQAAPARKRWLGDA